MFFDTYLLCSYNKLMNDLIIDCPCYQLYYPFENFVANIIEKRGSYMACLCYMSTVRKRIAHKSIPIMLGSYLDYRIRGRDRVIADRAQWGLFILKGLLKIYSNFSTFDSLSMHVREVKGTKLIDWYTYIGDEGFALKYSNKKVNWTFRKQESTDNDWVELLQESNPFDAYVLESEYISMFDTILDYPYSMNDLSNRQILNGAVAIRKYIQYDMNRRKKKSTGGGQKLNMVFEKGAIYVALSKKSLSDSSKFCRDYPQAYDYTMHEGRSNKTSHLLLNVVRASNQAVRNSNALAFPLDGINYYCMLNTKDLKSAGEQNVFADFVIMCEETDAQELYKYACSIAVPSGQHSLIINGYLINRRITWTLDTLVTMKHHFPHITTQYHLPYIQISTRASIPIKYCERYDTFFSPAETKFFGIKYPHADMLSITAKLLSLDSLIRTPPAKSTVSINNIKGSIAMVTSDLHKMLMENSLGVTCYMPITQEQIDSLIHTSVLAYNYKTEPFFYFFEKLDKKFHLTDIGSAYKPEQTDPAMAMRAMYRLYGMDHLLIENKRLSSPPYEQRVCEENRPLAQDYTGVVFSHEHYKPPDLWGLRARAMYGDFEGCCIVDGVVVDINFLAQLPPVIYNACITVEFSFATVKQPNDARFTSIYELPCEIQKDSPFASQLDDETLIGVLITEHDVYVKNSKHTKIVKTRIGEHFCHLVHFLPKKTGMYDNLKVRHIVKDKTIMVVITGQTEVKVGVGSKLANAFGQKNIISGVFDMSNIRGLTRDGRIVHPQIIYSEVSVVSRVTSGQLYEMFTSDELAFTQTGEIIAPVNLVLHTLHPYTNVKVIKVKNDTLTNINGFDSQNLSCVSHNLRIEKVFSKIGQVIGLHGHDLIFNEGELPNLPVIYGKHGKQSTSRSMKTEKKASASGVPPSSQKPNNLEWPDEYLEEDAEQQEDEDENDSAFCDIANEFEGSDDDAENYYESDSDECDVSPPEGDEGTYSFADLQPSMGEMQVFEEADTMYYDDDDENDRNSDGGDCGIIVDDFNDFTMYGESYEDIDDDECNEDECDNDEME